ncbi:MAG: N-acetylmuramoyl-L-alanine amidase [Phycisphaerales bacterium]|nr:N-acetylmuramoyl-L-alanine amidase [Phycisphaerales bacterium]
MTTDGRLMTNSNSSAGHAVISALLRSRRGMVLASFSGSMVFLASILVLMEGQRSPSVGGRSLAPMAVTTAGVPLDAITTPPAGLDEQRWKRIVVHHSRSRHGDAAQLARQHQDMGLAGLGYHFVIGNGRGMAEGELHVAERWLRQQPGAHVAGANSLDYNRDSIGVCLVGDGRLESFGRGQIDRLVATVSTLAHELDIPSSQIFLHQDVAGVDDPGPLFPREQFYQRLAEAGVRSH